MFNTLMERFGVRSPDDYISDNLSSSNCKETIDTVESKASPEPEENWVWVEGYKGFTKEYIDGELKLCGRNHFVYNPIGEETCLPENKDKKMDICSWGLHFCNKLQDVFNYCNAVCHVEYLNYSWNGYEITSSGEHTIYNTTFAKVKAEVNEKDYLSWKESNEDKFVARKIIIEEIIPYEDVYDACTKKDQCILIGSEEIPSKDTFIEVKNCLDNCGDNTLGAYYEIIKTLRDNRIKTQIESLVSHGYSEAFATIIVDKYSYNDAIMYAEEGLSKDMRAYLLTKDGAK